MYSFITRSNTPELEEASGTVAQNVKRSPSEAVS